MTEPAIARLYSIAQVARLMGRPRRTAFRQLLAVHALDRERGAELDWLVSDGPRRRGSALRVNLTALRRLHPEFFEQRYVTRDEMDAHEERITSLERKVERLRVA